MKFVTFIFLFSMLNIFIFKNISIAKDTEKTTDSKNESEIGKPSDNSTDPTVLGEEKVIYEYKKEDYFDFDALSVKGELLTPGDLTTKATKRVKFNPKKYVRKDFDEYIEDDLMEIY